MGRITAIGENQFFIQNKAGFTLSLRNEAKNPKGIISNHLTLDTEKFTFKPLKAGRFMIKNNKLNKCLDTDGKPKESGIYKMFKCKAGDEGQSFRFIRPTTVKLAKGWINIIGPDYLCLKNTGKGNKLIQSTCSDSAEMLWKFEVVKGNIFTVVNKKDQSVIDLSGSKTFKGNGLVSFKRNNSKSQTWNVQTAKKGHIILKSEASGRCLDGGKIKKGSSYRIWDCSKKNKSQQFRLQYARPSPPTKIKIVYRTKTGKIVNKDGGKLGIPKGTHIQSLEFQGKGVNSASKIGGRSGRSAKNGGRSAKNGGRSAKNGGQSAKNGGRSAKNGGGSAKNGGRSAKNGGRSSRKGKNGKKSIRRGGRSSKNNKRNNSNTKNTSIPKGAHIQSINFQNAPEKRSTN